MSTPAAIERQENLLKLRVFCQALFEAAQRAGMKAEEVSAAFRASLSAECVHCGQQVSGEELLALAHPATEDLTTKVNRLRLGDCARQGCESYFYRVTFQPQPSMDWSKLIHEAEALEPQLAQASSGRPKPGLGLWIPNKVLVALAGLVLLLFLRQWYMGGRIPFIREPEKFRVDPAPEAGATQ